MDKCWLALLNYSSATKSQMVKWIRSIRNSFRFTLTFTKQEPIDFVRYTLILTLRNWQQRGQFFVHESRIHHRIATGWHEISLNRDDCIPLSNVKWKIKNVLAHFTPFFIQPTFQFLTREQPSSELNPVNSNLILHTWFPYENRVNRLKRFYRPLRILMIIEWILFKISFGMPAYFSSTIHLREQGSLTSSDGLTHSFRCSFCFIWGQF